VYEEMIKPNC